MNKTGKRVSMVCFIINLLLCAVVLIYSCSQYLIMASHLGSNNVYVREQGVHVLIMLFLSVCTFGVKSVKHPSASVILSVALTITIVLYFAIVAVWVSLG